MKKNIKKGLAIHDFLIKTNSFLFLFIISSFGVFLNIVLSIISYDFLGENLGDQNDLLVSLTRNMEFILAIIIAPFFETAIFQYFFIILILDLLIKKPTPFHLFLLVLISSILFALTHLFSLLYFIHAFIMGFYFGYISLLSEYFREKKINIFISVLLTHSLINLVAFLFE